MKKNLIRWFKRAPRSFTTERDIPTLSPDEFQSSEPLMSGLRRSINSQAFQVALRVIEDAKPIGIPGAGTQPTDYAYNYGLALGYSMALDNLRNLANIVQQQQVEATFTYSAENPTEVPDTV
ncbi:MAG: hypothetical protein WCG75_00075 [Armatimonadota bacterium]